MDPSEFLMMVMNSTLLLDAHTIILRCAFNFMDGHINPLGPIFEPWVHNSCFKKLCP